MTEQKQSKSWNAPVLKVGMEKRMTAKSLKNGARDGARTRDLRRDRPEAKAKNPCTIKAPLRV
jgi:hypothetical protein